MLQGSCHYPSQQSCQPTQNVDESEIFFLTPTEQAKGDSGKKQPCAAINLGD